MADETKNAINKDDKDSVIREKYRTEFFKDVDNRRSQHRKMNYHYLQYKGILWLNSVYGEDYCKTIGMQAFVPRTFMTIEAMRPHLSGRPLDIALKGGKSRKSRINAIKGAMMLKGEWYRSGADWQKADAEFYGLLLGTGFLLSYYADDWKKGPIYNGLDKDGKIVWKEGKIQKYKGMKLKSLNPWFVFPDYRARNDEDLDHYYVYSMWEFKKWKKYCKQNEFNTTGMVKGGHLEEFDSVRRRIDSIYGATNIDIKTRQDGILTSQPIEKEAMDTTGMIMVVERFSEDEYAVMSGANWTLNHKDVNPDPDKIINIKAIRDYRVPDEFDGIGEAEVIRWQQFEENKIHGLAYMSVLMSTVQRFGIIEDYLADPTEAGFSNPLKWIHLKHVTGGDISKAMVPLNTKSPNDVPWKFLEIVDNIRQEATGMNAYTGGAGKADAETLGEAGMMREAGMEVIQHKVYQIEERDLTDILKHWLVCIPQYADEEMDVYLNDKNDTDIKFLPWDRQFNEHLPTVSKISAKNGINGETTIEAVYKKMGYKEVIFASDLVGGYDVVFRTATAASDKVKMWKQYNALLDTLMNINNHLRIIGKPPVYDVEELGDEALRLFPDMVESPENYKLPPQPIMPALPQPGGEIPPEMANRGSPPAPETMPQPMAPAPQV